MVSQMCASRTSQFCTFFLSLLSSVPPTLPLPSTVAFPFHTCYGLNICVPSKFTYWSHKAQCDGIGGG